MSEKEKADVKLSAALKNLKETIKAEEKKKKQLEKSLADVSIVALRWWEFSKGETFSPFECERQTQVFFSSFSYIFSFQDIKAIENKQKEGEKLQGTFDTMRAKDKADQDALAAAEKRLQAISSGMYSAGDGEDATLQEQLISKFYFTLSL